MEGKAQTQNVSELEAIDQTNIWHPFTQAKTAPSPIPIVRGEGCYLVAADGTRYLDAISSWWVNIHGHANSYIANKIADQAMTLEHVMFADFTHAPACELAKRLLKHLPGNLSRIFYCTTGSTAVETALKISIQYWYNKGHPRTKVVAFKKGYHGDTVGAMSTSARGLFTKPFEPLLFDLITIDPPAFGQEEISANQLRQALADNDVACFFYEPQVQGASGMHIHSKEGLDDLIAICKAHGVLAIADEVMTGFGRTGPLFVSNTLKNKPDIICLSKSLTAGYLPMAATICTEELFQAFLSDDLARALLHGHTYAGNPIGCAAALASLDLLEDPACERQRAMIEHQHKLFQARILNHPHIKRCEVVGTILIVEYHDDSKGSYYSPFRDRLARFFLDNYVHLRPFGNMIHVMPPYCIVEDDLQLIYTVIERSLKELF
ncbi:MAG: adenosylmethionine--8-amino-7-oxononanoate transaminase [Nitrosomonas sp.]|nr:MAG: adenosylmethionine--8-amino-7-oxononanoate transaminase [Nitrosomonas sp.]